MQIKIPQLKISPKDRDLYFGDSEILTLELLFLVFSVLNVLVIYYIVSVVIPFPITVTWFQFAIALAFSRVFGECGQEYPKLAFFTPLRLKLDELKQLAFPATAFVAMITTGNILLHRLPSVALFPVTAALAVAFHHTTRLVGCGQVYSPFRWASMGVLVLGFLLATFDMNSLGYGIGSTAVIYALTASTYRACFMERAMHIVKGLGNNLHNDQLAVGVLLLPCVIPFTRESRFLTYMPTNISRSYTWLMWGCLVTAAVLPLCKNVVANRLIRLGGQPPWRFIELASVVSIFLIGWSLFGRVGPLGIASFLCVLAGRAMNTVDALSADSYIEPPQLGNMGPKLKSPSDRPDRKRGAGDMQGFSIAPLGLGGSGGPDAGMGGGAGAGGEGGLGAGDGVGAGAGAGAGAGSGEGAGGMGGAGGSYTELGPPTGSLMPEESDPQGGISRPAPSPPSGGQATTVDL